MITDGFFKRKFINPILALLKQGTSPKKLALALALGIAIAAIPVFGTCTLLCLLVAFLFQLNIPLLLLINNVLYPLQFVLYVPLMKLGDWVFNSSNFKLSVNEVYELFKEDVLAAIQTLWSATIHATVAWLLVFIPLAFFIYFITLPLFKKLLIKNTEIVD